MFPKHGIVAKGFSYFPPFHALNVSVAVITVPVIRGLVIIIISLVVIIIIIIIQKKKVYPNRIMSKI